MKQQFPFVIVAVVALVWMGIPDIQSTPNLASAQAPAPPAETFAWPPEEEPREEVIPESQQDVNLDLSWLDAAESPPDGHGMNADPSPHDATRSVAFDPCDYAYRIRATGIEAATGRQISFEGTAIAMGGENMLTVAHLTQGMRKTSNSPSVQVEIDGEWKGVWFTPRTGVDVADVRVPGANFPEIPERSPEYMEEVIAFGLRSGVPRKGIYSAHRTVSLYPGEAESMQGDSGGAVFSLTGEYLGTVSGYDGSDANGNPAPLVVKFDESQGNAPAVQQAASAVMVDGLGVDEFIAKYHRGRNWTYPGTIASHLREHGLSDDEIAQLSTTQQKNLHAAIHEKESGGSRVVSQAPAPRPVSRTPQVSSCPGGVCPSPTYSQPGFRIFRRRR